MRRSTASMATSRRRVRAAPPTGRSCRRPRAATSSTSSAAPTSRSPPRSTGSSPTRSSRAGCSPARACRRSASSARRCASTPTPSAPSTAGWPTPGYVVGRHGAGTRVVDRPPVRRGSDALAGHRRGDAAAGRRSSGSPPTRSPRPRSPPRPSASARAARPRPVRRVHERRRDVRRRADHRGVPGPGRGRSRVLLDELPERLDRYHYDLVATTTFHADEAQAYVARPRAGRRDAGRPRLHVAGPRDRGAAAGLEGGRGVRLAARRREHRRGAPARGRDRRRDRVGRRPHGGRAGPGRPRRGHRAAVARGDGPGARRPVRAAGAAPGVELRVRPRRPRAAPPRDRARRAAREPVPA